MHETPETSDTPDTPKSNIKGCLSLILIIAGIVLIIAGIAGLLYSLPFLACATQKINPIDRQTIIIAILFLVMRNRGAK